MSRRLSIDLKALLERDVVSITLPEPVRFKRTMQVTDTPPNEPFLAYARALARSVAVALPGPSSVPFSNPLKERAIILSDPKIRWISLDALLRRCWQDLGIAVVQPRDAPQSGKGFDAATFCIDGRYVIVLAKLVAHPARAAFFLAHEFGHIAGGNVQDGQAILDDEPDFDDGGADGEETAANAYALALLGDKTTRVAIVGEANPASLASTAIEVGGSRRIDPGHLVLRFAYDSKEWQVAQAALKRLKPKQEASDSINSIALRELDFANVADDVRQFILDALTWHD